MRPRFFALALLLVLALRLPVPAAPVAATSTHKPAAFGVAAHPDVSIEWWYVNAHVTTDKGRHLALIGSFFRFGSGVNPFDGSPLPRAHYLIYAVTDLDKKTQRPYSLADSNMISLMRQFGPLLAAQNPHDPAMRSFVTALNAGHLPAPHRKIAGAASVVSAPFRLAYGRDNTLTATNSADTSFDLNLNAGGPDQVHLTLTAQKPPMAVGGKGETGLKRANDMYYFSLTRCTVGGTVSTGTGAETVTAGQGWFDHQWGNSWVASNDGWDWWGVQLDDGTDILFFRQRDLKTGRVFFPLATFMDKNGRQSVTKKIVFAPDKSALWKSPKSGVTYPLGWEIYFPEKGLALHVTAAVRNQEMPILGPGAGIWEGLCNVSGVDMNNPKGPEPRKVGDTYSRKTGLGTTTFEGVLTPTLKGIAYMELVGYGSPAVKATLAKPTAVWRGRGK